MKVQEFKVWVRRQLGEDDGCPSVKVELSEKQIEQALKNAIEWFNAFFPLYREGGFTLIAGQNEYDLSGVEPGVEDIVTAWFPLPASRIDFNVLYPGFLDINGFPCGMGGPMATGSAGTWGAGYPHTTVVQTLQTIQTSEKFLSSDLDWEFYRDTTTEPVTRIMRVMPAPATEVGQCVYRYSINPEDIKLEWYDAKRLYFLKQWALADAKYILGRKRGKYPGGLPTAGGERQLDGEQLLSESKDEKEMLEQKILDIQGPVLPMVY